MFSPEKLLGGLISGGMRRKSGGLGSLISSGAAMGLVGIAMEAVEHLMNQSQGTSPHPGPPPMASPTGMTPSPVTGNKVPPPAPGGPKPPPLPGANVTPTEPVQGQRQSDAVLLIRAMIAAANSDGVIDAQERANILNKLKSVQLTEEEHQFITHELLDPKSMQSIAASVESTDLARQVYLVSLLAIVIDTEAEKDYLRALAKALCLDADTVQKMHQQVGVDSIM